MLTSRSANSPGTRVLAQSAVPSSITGTLTETVLATITVPANSMGPNGSLSIVSTWSCTTSANNKIFKLRFGGIGGTQYGNVTVTANQSAKDQRDIFNRNAANSQIGGPSGATGGWGGSSAVAVTSALDTTADQTLVLTGTLTNTGETITLEAYRVMISYGA